MVQNLISNEHNEIWKENVITLLVQKTHPCFGILDHFLCPFSCVEGNKDLIWVGNVGSSI